MFFSLLTNNFTPETALPKLLYTGKVTALTLLDLYAAFDNSDYSVLLDRLSHWYVLNKRQSGDSPRTTKQYGSGFSTLHMSLDNSYVLAVVVSHQWHLTGNI